MPLERKPLKPLARGFVPAPSIPYRVADGDTWGTVAARYSLDPKALIKFNFKTNNTDEVNWYLRQTVGCKVTRDGLNWAFSSSADPGVIYIPIGVLNIEPDDEEAFQIEGKSSVSKVAMAFEVNEHPWLEKVDLGFSLYTVVDAGLAIFAVELGVTGLVGGLVVTALAPFAALGAPHAAAINDIRNRQMLRGLTIGIAVGVDNLSLQRAKGLELLQLWPVTGTQYDDHGRQFQNDYNNSFFAGYAHGKGFNTIARKNFFKYVWSHMRPLVKEDYLGNPPLHVHELEEYARNWNERKRQQYYRDIAVTLMPLFR